MRYLSKMYGRKPQVQTQSSSDKNPNRVTGGLRAQGVDTLTLLGEDGSQKEIPTVEYVRSLEDQSKKQRAQINVLERRLTRLDTAFNALQNSLSQR